MALGSYTTIRDATRVYRADRSYTASVLDVAAERFFYSESSADGIETLDEVITRYEDGLAQDLSELNAAGAVVSATAARAVAHLFARNDHTRGFLRQGSTALAKFVGDLFGSSEKIAQLLGIAGPLPGSQFKKVFAEHLADNEIVKANQLRFAFPDPLTSETLAPLLKHYLTKARGYGPNTSLVVFGRPGPVQSLEAYRARFWELLAGLAALDNHPWPADIPEALDTPGWEFSFAGEPIFVVCNTPAHVQRQSRRSTGFMMTFQPRWVFETILGSEAAAERAYQKVRERLVTYDLLPPSPALGRYGETENREFAQYFLGDDNERARCPFHSLTPKKEQAA